jgi:hypothetical protein
LRGRLAGDVEKGPADIRYHRRSLCSGEKDFVLFTTSLMCYDDGENGEKTCPVHQLLAQQS